MNKTEGWRAEDDKQPNNTFNTPPSRQTKSDDNYTNNTQAYEFEEAINNPDTQPTTQQITVIMDTGATFTMLPRVAGTIGAPPKRKMTNSGPIFSRYYTLYIKRNIQLVF